MHAANKFMGNCSTSLFSNFGIWVCSLFREKLFIKSLRNHTTQPTFLFILEVIYEAHCQLVLFNVYAACVLNATFISLPLSCSEMCCCFTLGFLNMHRFSLCLENGCGERKRLSKLGSGSLLLSFLVMQDQLRHYQMTCACGFFIFSLWRCLELECAFNSLMHWL